ncbi:hypothetical protein [Paenibacillus sinopodophylli]|uniref:hypothetical protein n=1 Tax=Paenibacillus sinopodophylli TaxID=1837342 RepID=UPI00110CAE28|nr:hypothetical protein [Paenibacillus sinopodophylli]
MAKKEEKKRITAPKPTYTPINSVLNSTYTPPAFETSSNLVVSQQDLMPRQNTSQPLQVRGALSRNQPEVKQTPVSNPFPLLPTVFENQQAANNLFQQQPQKQVPSVVRQPAQTPQSFIDLQSQREKLFPTTRVQQNPVLSELSGVADQQDWRYQPEIPMTSKEWILNQKDHRAANNIPGYEPLDVVGDYFEAYTPGIAAFQKGAGNALNIQTQTAPIKGSEIVNGIAGALGGLAGLATNPAALEQGLITGGYKIANAAMNSKVGQAIGSMGQKAITKSANAINPALNTVGINIGSNITNGIANRALTGSIAGGVQGASISGVRGETDADQVLKSTLYGAALGGVGDVAIAGIGAGISKLFKRNGVTVPDTEIQEMLALPAPRQRGNANGAQTPDTMPGFGGGRLPELPAPGPLGLPEPQIQAPTTGRIAQQSNPYREQFEILIQQAKQLQEEGRFTPGREDADLESLWSQMAGREGVSLDELIQRAYPSKPNRVNPDLVQNARTYQAAREVAGAPLPVKTRTERLIKNQGALSRAESPVERVGRTPQEPPFSKQEIIQPNSRISGSRIEVNPDAVKSGEIINSKPIEVRGALSSPRSSQPIIQELQSPLQSPKINDLVVPEVQLKNLRANYQNQLKNGNFSSELQQNIRNTDQTYDVARNADTVAKANENVKDLPKAEADFLANQSANAEHIATGYRLMQQLDALGEHQRSLNVADKLASDLTKSGQTVQAASLLARLSPEGQLLNLTRAAARNGKEVSVADKVKFQELAAVVQDNTGAGVRANRFDEILNRLEKGETVSPDELKTLGNMLERANKYTKTPKEMKDVLPDELKDVKKREKIISYFDDAEQAALARIAARKSRLNSLPFDEWKDHSIVVASQLVKGTIKAATYAEDMVKLFGEEIRPVAAQVFEKAQKLVTGTSRSISEGKINQANRVLRNLSGESQKEKAIVAEMATHVRKVISDSKQGNLNPEDIQKLRDYSEEIAEIMENKKNSPLMTSEQKYLQSVKSLAKKIADVESGSVPADKANREVSNLLRQVTKLSKDGESPITLEPLDSKALIDIAHDVLEKTRPPAKPTTLQEKIVEKYIKENLVSETDIQKLRELAKRVNELSGDEAVNADMAMQKILNSYEKSSLWDKIQALRYIAMLLNSSTQAVNAISGPIMATTGTIADVFGTMIDIPMSKLLKQPRTTTLYGTNPLAFISRWMKYAKVGGKAGFNGVNPAGIAGPNEIRGLTYKSLYNPLSLAERSLGAVAKGADYGAYKAVQISEMRKMAFLDAKNKGIKGKSNIDEHIKKFVNDPPPEAILQADRIGKNTTFQRSDTFGGSTANFLANMPGKAKYLKPAIGAVLPFVRTPVNIASTAVTLTPGGIIKGLFQLTSKSDASRREAIRTLSLGLTGTGLSALGYALSSMGIITGANDSGNKNVDALKEQIGEGKYRFNTSAMGRYLKSMLEGKGHEASAKAAKYQEGDKQFDYNRLQPLAFPLAAGAAFNERKDEPLDNQVGGTLSDAAGSFLGMSTLRGVQDVFQPQYGGTTGEKAIGIFERVATSFLKSFSPSALAQEARRQDPIQRKTSYNNGILEDTKAYFQSRTPGLSQSLPPNKTTLGQTKMNAPGITGQYLNPFKSEVAPYNEAAAIVSQLIDSTGDEKLAPSAPEKTVSGKNSKNESVTLSIPPDRYARYQEDLGNEITKKIVSIPNNLSDNAKADKVREIYKKTEAKHRNIIKRELGIRVLGG